MTKTTTIAVAAHFHSFAYQIQTTFNLLKHIYASSKITCQRYQELLFFLWFGFIELEARSNEGEREREKEDGKESKEKKYHPIG